MELKSKGWSALFLALLCTVVPGGAWAQNYSYSVYVDSDARASTGCAEGLAVGAEVRLQVTASGGLAPQVLQVTRARCESGLFGAPSTIGGNYPVGIDNGTDGADVIELADDFSVLAGNGSPSLVFSIIARSAAGEDTLLSSDAAPIALGLPAVAIPLLGIPALILMAVLLGLVGARMSRRRLWRVVALLSLVSGVAVAANFIVDGQVGDWNGVSVLATDPAGDSSSGESAIDLRAFFGAIENDRVYLRIDVSNLENNAPIAVAGSATTLEDQAVTVNLSGTDNENDALTFSIVDAPTNGSLGAIVPTGPQSATVQFTPNPDANGNDSFNFTVDDGQVVSAPATIALTVTPVNDVPGFTAGADQNVLEDAGAQTLNAWASAISAGPANESGQALDFIVSNDNNSLFSVQPAVSADGTLSYTPADDANGSATVTLSLHDDGGTANGGVDTSPTQTFTITVASVNDAPVFTPGADVSVAENAPAQTIDPWATAISAGAGNEAGQVLTFAVSNDNNALFSVQPGVSPTGALSFTPAPTLNGTATVTISLVDDGGTANGGDDTSDAQTFTITVVGVNDPPSFTAGGDQTVNEDAGAQTVDPWATAILAGPPNESGQTVGFSITGNTNAALFSAGPAVSATGALTYTPADNAAGVASITLVAVDDGGTANGGVDTSPPQTFLITVNPINDPPALDLNGAATGTGFAATYTEGDAAVAIVDAAALSVADVDNATLASATVSISNLLDGTFEALSANTGGTAIVAGYNGTTGTLTLTGPDSVANFQSVLRTLVYSNASTAPSEIARLINVVANDGSVDSNLATSTVTVVGVNTIPSFTGGAPVAINEDAGAQSIANWATAVDDNDGGLQTLNFSVTQTGGTLGFSAAPTLSPTGTLSFTTADDANGSATFDVVLTDSGSDNNTSAAQTLTITATAVNDAPSFTVGPDEDILENAGAQTVNPWATAISAGPADEAAQTLAFTITGNDNPALFSAGPSVSPSGVLSYTTATDVSGVANITLSLADSGGTANGGIDTSAPQSFSITVNNVNSAPVFTVGGNQTVNEDAGPQTVAPWATGVDDGDPTVTQVLTFNVTGNTNPGLFSAGPTVNAAGALSYTPAADVSGTATITLALSDDGGTAFGGVDTSAPQTFDITVNPVNDAPSFTPGANQSVNEDSGAQSVPWASAISAGAADESGQTLSFNVTGNTNPGLFSSAPTIAPNGTLSYTPNTNVSGTATITLTLSDNGGTANGGVDTSPAQTFDITVNEVNDAPSFAVGPDQDVLDNAGALTIDPWATGLSAGPPAEAGQSLSFVIDGNTAPGIFAAGPSVSPTGALSFTPAIVPVGTSTAIITLHIVDNGGTANGGVNVSAPQSFTIEITHANEAPVLTNDPISYATVGNTQLAVAGATLPGLVSISDADSALTKSQPTDPDGPSAPAVVAAAGTSANGGDYSIAADGAFSYVPPAGFAGVDSFTYQVTDGNTPIPGVVTGTINITVGPTVWYINNQTDANNPSAGSDGRSNNAFETLGAAQSASGDGDILFVFNGVSAATPYTGGIVLKDGQRLWGEGFGLSVAPFGSLVAAGTQPRINAASADAVSVPATAGDRLGVEIRGLDLQGNPNAIDVTSSGANAVGIIIDDNSVRGANVEGIDVNFGATATQQIAIENNTVSASGIGISVIRSAGTATITGFANNAISGNTGGAGIGVDSMVFDAIPGNPINPVNGGTTVIGAVGNGVGANGLMLTNVTGELSFTDLDIVSSVVGSGLSVSSTGALNAGAGTGFRIAVPSGVATIDSTGGPALDVNNASISLPMVDVRSANSTFAGISLVNAFGGVGQTAFSATSGQITDPAGPSGIAFNVDGGNGNISFPGAITSNSGNSVRIQNRTSGNVNLSGNISDTGAGINLTSNTGATIDVGGVLTLNTGVNGAFNATGGGTVSASNTANSAATTTATAINVANTTIAASGLNFLTVNAGTAASGPINGIRLENTGTLGGLTVFGSGALGSGGTIQRTSGDGIALIDTQSPSFGLMSIQNTGGNGVGGRGVTNFSFTNNIVNNTGIGLGPESASLAFNTTAAGTENNLDGVVVITGNTLTNSYYHGIDIFNFNGTISNATISNNVIFSSTSTANSLGSGVRLIAFGSASTVANVTRATIANNEVVNFPSAGGIQTQGGNANAAGPAGIFGVAGSATDVIAITGNRVTGASPATRMGTQAILAVVNGRGQGNFDISSNGTVANPLGNTIGTVIAQSALGNANVTSTISNNVIVANNTFGSNGIGAGTSSTFGPTDTPSLAVTISNNAISQTDGNGILVTARDASGSVRSRILNNTVAAPLGGFRQGIRIDAGNNISIDDSVCLNISGNTTSGNNNAGVISSGIGLRRQGTVPTTNDFAINGMVATASPGVENYVGGLNPASTTGNFGTTGTDMISAASSGFSNCSLP